MGVDIIGLNPKNEKGEYFRSNWWYWRPIWAFTVIVCEDIMNEIAKMEVEDEEGNLRRISYSKFRVGLSNDCLVIEAEDAEEIGRRIMKILAPERDVVKRVADGLKGSPYDVIASRVRELFSKHYVLDRDLLRKWAEFCLNCGGFSVG